MSMMDSSEQRLLIKMPEFSVEMLLPRWKVEKHMIGTFLTRTIPI